MGSIVSVADAERAAIMLALAQHTDQDTLLILTDSQAAREAVLNLCRGAQLRSHIEIAIKNLLRTQADLDRAIAWLCC